MFIAPQKKFFAALIAIAILVSAVVISCGDSQGVEALNACLSEFSELVDNYKATVSTDKSKQAEWDAKIEAMNQKWANIRNEFGSAVTPQHMETMVQKYDRLMNALNKFKKAIGS